MNTINPAPRFIMSAGSSTPTLGQLLPPGFTAPAEGAAAAPTCGPADGATGSRADGATGGGKTGTVTDDGPVVTNPTGGRPADSYEIPIRDARVRAFLDTLPSEAERREQLGRAAELGVLALQAARPMDVAVDLQRRFIELTEKVQRDATGAFDGEIAQLRGDLSSVVARVESQIRLLDEKAGHIVDQEKRLDELINATEHNSALMGANFEARLVNNLDHFAAPRSGDSVTYTGNTNDVDKKVGDIVYRLAINGNPDDTVGVAIEAKDRPCTRSGPKAYYLDELDAGMANRNCPYGIVVTTMEKNSAQERPTFPFIQALPGKRFVVLVDELVHYPIALEATLQAIHKEVVNARAATTPEVDVHRINEAVVRAVGVAEMFRALKSNLTSQVGELTRMRDNVDKMQSQFENSMADVRKEIERATGR